VDAIGREHQLSTIQLDFNQPERFHLVYIDEKGQKQRPVMIHRALNGSFERMLGILIEHYGGNFPTWLAPEQVRLITVNDDPAILARAEEIKQDLSYGHIYRVTIDTSAESVGKKIRAASMQKIPYTMVVGEQEAASPMVSPRVRPDLLADSAEQPGSLNFDEFRAAIVSEIGLRSLTSRVKASDAKQQ
jgi:threonyl-tRNA synthetase